MGTVNLMRLFLFMLINLVGTSAHGYSVIGIEDLLKPDPGLRAQKAVEHGNRSLIAPIFCEDESIFYSLNLDSEWYSSEIISPEKNCDELRASPEYSPDIEKIQKAIATYNVAVVRRSKELGLFSVYHGEKMPDDSIGPQNAYWSAKASEMLAKATGVPDLRATEFSVFEKAKKPSRLFIAGESNTAEIQKRLAGSKWRKCAYPSELLQAMHWNPSPQDACLIGRVDGYPAYLLLRSHFNSVVLVVGLSLGGTR
jgi:hypothetical protein